MVRQAIYSKSIWTCCGRSRDVMEKRTGDDNLKDLNTQAMGQGRDKAESNDPTIDTRYEVENAGRWRQYFTTFVVCLTAYGTGLSSGWASPMLIKLKSADSPVGNMTLTQMSFLESLPTVSGLIAVYFFGIVVDSFGRKPAGYIVAVSGIIGWMFLVVASIPLHLYIGRFFAGFASLGGLTVGPIFLSEIVHDSRRGSLLSFILVLVNVASLQAFVLGDVLNYQMFNITCIIAPALFPFFFFWLPESPYYLASKLRFAEAESSLLWYRGGNSNTITLELPHLLSPRTTSQSFLTIIKSKVSRKAILIVLFMFSFQQLSGAQIISGYASLIFEDSGDPISPNKAAIILAVIKLVATTCSSLLIDRVNRRFLMISSFLLMSLSLTVLAVFLLIKEYGWATVDYYTWTPLACLSAFTVVSSLGVATLPQVISNEIIPPQVKGTASIINGTISMIVIFVCLQSFVFIRQHIGMFANFVPPSATNILGCFIAYYVLPETRGKSINEILDELDSQ